MSITYRFNKTKFEMVVAVGLFIGFVSLILAEETFLNKTFYSEHIIPQHKCIIEHKADLVIYCMSPHNMGAQVDELVKVNLTFLYMKGWVREGS